VPRKCPGNRGSGRRQRDKRRPPSGRCFLRRGKDTMDPLCFRWCRDISFCPARYPVTCERVACGSQPRTCRDSGAVARDRSGDRRARGRPRSRSPRTCECSVALAVPCVMCPYRSTRGPRHTHLHDQSGSGAMSTRRHCSIQW
jgi:hypothetical protein